MAENPFVPANFTPSSIFYLSYQIWIRSQYTNNSSLSFFLLFSFDVRGRQFNQAKFWSSPAVFGKRAFFRATTSPATLVIDDIQLSDEGVYRCRVDFKNSPTRNSKVNFTVIGKCQNAVANIRNLSIGNKSDENITSQSWYGFSLLNSRRKDTLKQSFKVIHLGGRAIEISIRLSVGHTLQFHVT